MSLLSGLVSPRTWLAFVHQVTGLAVRFASGFACTLTVAVWAAVTGLTAPLYAGSLPGGALSVDGTPYPGTAGLVIAAAAGLVALLAA